MNLDDFFRLKLNRYKDSTYWAFSRIKKELEPFKDETGEIAPEEVDQYIRKNILAKNKYDKPDWDFRTAITSLDREYKRQTGEVKELQKRAGIPVEEDDDYDLGTPTGDTAPENIAEDDFGKISRGLEDNPLP